MRSATCHPLKKHVGGGMCWSCYNKWRRTDPTKLLGMRESYKKHYYANHEAMLASQKPKWARYYAKNRQAMISRAVSYGKRKRVEFRAWVDPMKAAPCLDCGGVFPPYVMDFDHRDGTGKLFCVGSCVTRSKELVLAEIEKCDLVCSNCHRIRTHNRRRHATKHSLATQTVAPPRTPRVGR